jgi:outer membrane murein-binding lipoprotein Lpp
MKLKLIVGATVLASSILLSGCGSDTPEDVATSFAEALSEADMKEVEKVSSEDVQNKIGKLTSICNQSVVQGLIKESSTVMQTIENMGTDEKKKVKIDALMENFNKNILATMEEMKKESKTKQKELVSKYGSINKIPDVEKEKIMMAMKDKMVSITLPLIEEIFDINDIKTKNPKKVKSILAEFFFKGGEKLTYRTQNILRNIVTTYVESNPEKMTVECVAKYTDFGFIDNINIIETITKSPDRVDVRLELIDKDDKSKKVSVYVEKIKNEWKVSELSLNNLW